MAYGVALIIGTAYDDLEALASRLHVWAPDTDENKRLAERIRARNEASANKEDLGVTLYYYEPGEAAEDTFLSLIDTIDLHHGAHSHDPAWSFIEVYGLDPVEPVRTAFGEYDVNQFELLEGGFRAIKDAVG